MKSRATALTLILIFTVVQSVSLAECCCGSECPLLAPAPENTGCCETEGESPRTAPTDACVHVAPSDQIVLEHGDVQNPVAEVEAVITEVIVLPSRNLVATVPIDDPGPPLYLSLGILRL